MTDEGLTRFVVDEPPPEGNRRGSWQRRLEEIIGQGLTGRWINATEAWGTKPNGKPSALAAAESCGVTLEWRSAKGVAYVRIKG
jgi:hypothetical protein